MGVIDTAKKVNRLKRRIKIIAVIIIIFAVVFAIIGAISILSNAEIIDIDEYGTTVNTNMNIDSTVTPDIEELIQLSDEEVWKLLTGKEYSEKPALSEVPESTMRPMMEYIEVPIRTPDGDSTTSFEVHRALAKLFTGFFTDLYNQCPDFYIINDGGYDFKDVNNGNTGAASAHAFGAAVDINYSANPQYQKPLTASEWNSYTGKDKNYKIYYESQMVKIAEKYSLSWGGYWSDSCIDPCHFSFIGDWTRERTKQQYNT